MKEFLRGILFVICVYFGWDEFKAEEGTFWFRFLDWVYGGEAEPEFDSWFPEDDDEGKNNG
jgi:hypothetical protein